MSTVLVKPEPLPGWFGRLLFAIYRAAGAEWMIQDGVLTVIVRGHIKHVRISGKVVS